MMNKLEIDLSDQSIIGNKAPSIIVDGNQLNDVAGFDITARAGKFTKAAFDIYIHDLKVSADAVITINANPVTNDIGFMALESLLQYFLISDEYGVREKIKVLLTRYVNQ